MNYIFKFPDIGEGLEEGKIVEWYVEKGQRIKSGDPIVKMETDKVVTDIPSPKSGVIAQRFGGVGDVVKVGNALVEISIGDSSVVTPDSLQNSKAVSSGNEPIEEKGFGVVGTLEIASDTAYLPQTGEGFTQTSNPTERPKNKVLATPVARAMAKELAIDINIILGTGPAGRVMKKDVEQYHAGKKYLDRDAMEPFNDVKKAELIQEIPLSMIRKTIAKNMTRSKQNAVHMSVMDEVEVSGLVTARKELNSKLNIEGIKLSYLPFIVKAVSLALKNYPSLNSELDLEHDRIILKKYYNIGLAVDTEDGLVVPVIRNADKKSIVQISKEINVVVDKARHRKLVSDDMKDGTFTITSYGSIGGYFAVPVINYPQAAILGIGRITEKPVVKDSQVIVGNVLPISMSVDHRIIDGGEVARFLNEVLEYIRNPLLMLINQGENYEV